MKTQFLSGKAVAHAMLGVALAMNGFTVSAHAADALPTGGQFVAGQGSIQGGGTHLAITQGSAAGIINWNGFSIGAGHSVAINNGAGATLNRVTGADLSQLNGLLTSTGSTYLINPNGIVVGAGGEIITGGAFVASTRDIANEDFLDGGAMSFSGASDGTIVNAGTIVSAHGDVVLIGRAVENKGTITAAEGVASLAAGDDLLLQTEGTGQRVFIQGANAKGDVTNEGAVTAAQAELQAANGNVYALAGNTGGIVRATGSTVREGRILLTASDAAVLTGELEARNADGAGGRIDVAADDITIAGHVDVSASADGKDGGTAIIIARDEINVSGTLEGKGGKGATGGFIETSGAEIDIADTTRVTTLTEEGTTGTWLIDPNDLIVAASGGDITGATVSTNLQSTNVTLDSDNGGSGVNGDIFISDSISWSANTLLTLDAVRNIEFGANIAASGASAGVSLIYGGDYNLNGQSISLPGASSTFSVNGQAYTLIRDLTGLNAISDNNGFYALANDIDASASGTLNGGNGWAAKFNAPGFNGTFAGFGHNISGLTSTSGGGLIALANGSALIRDLGLVNANFSAIGNQAGALVRHNDGTIENAYATGTVTGTFILGGLVGYNTGDISNSWTDVTVTATSATGAAGGLSGYNNGGNLTDVYAMGDVTGGTTVGGLVGHQTQDASITRAFATGNVTGVVDVGGLVGRVFYSFAGAEPPTNSLITSTWASGRVTGTTNVGGLVGLNGTKGIVSNSYWDSSTTGQAQGVGTNTNIFTASAVTNANARTQATYSNFNFTNDWVLIIDNNTGTGRTRPLLRSQIQTGIHNEVQLQLIDTAPAGNYTLERDIDFNGAFDVVGGSRPGIWGANGFKSLELSAVFDGQGHTITGLLIDEITESNRGLFGFVQGTIRNVGLVGGTVRGYGAVGGLVGYLDASGRVERSFSSANVEGDTNGEGIGGLVGSSYGTVTEAFATGKILSGHSVGGLVGLNSTSGIINNSFATGAVSGDFQGGGLVGRNDGTITSSYATGPVTAVVTHGIVRGAPGSIVTDTYFDQEAGAPVSEMGTGLTTAQLQGTLPTGFSSSIWGTGAGLYPYLKWRFPTGPVVASGTATNNGAALVGTTVDLVTGGSTIGTATTGANGYFYQTFDPGTFAATGVLAYLNDQANDGVAFSNLAGPNVGDLDIGVNGVNLLTEDASFTAALADFAATLLGFVDTDLNFFSRTANSLTNNAGNVTLHSGNALTLDGNLTAGNDIILRSAGAMTASSARQLNAGRDLNVDTNLEWLDNSTELALTATRDIIFQSGKTIGTAGTGRLLLNAGTNVQTLGGNSVNVNRFALLGGNWRQTGTLPAFAASDFRLTGGSFLRATGGAGTSVSPYQIADVYGLQGIGSLNLLGSHFRLANAIDASSTSGWNGGLGFKPIGDDTNLFTGSLDGLGNNINGLTINRPTEFHVGLFGYTGAASQLRNIALTGGGVSGRSNVGALVGTSDGLVSGSRSSNSVIGNSNSIGGLIGVSNGTINTSHAMGTVTGNSANDIGGLVGTMNTGSLSRSFATGSVVTSGVSNVSGFNAGGLVGFASGGTISESFATGNVFTGGNTAGGLIGSNNAAVTNSYAKGNVSANDFAGGFVGAQGFGGSISNSYASGTTTVSPTLSVGGFVGEVGFGAGGTITNSFWNTTTSGRANAIGSENAAGTVITGRTTAEMQTLATFTGAGWAIDDAGHTGNPWRIYEGHTSPLLRTFLNPVTINVDNKSKVYDGAAFAGSYTTTGGTFGALGTLGSNLSAVSDAGTYAIRGLFSAQFGSDILYQNAQLSITPKALTLVATANNKVYDGTTAATGTIGALVGVVGADNVTANGSGSFAFADANVGNGKAVTVTGLALSGTDAGNYTLSSTGASTANITPATLTVTANAGTKVYGSVDPSLTFGHAGFVGLDTAALFTGSLARAVGETVAGGPYAINQGSLTAGGNYAITYNGANFTITPASLTVTANAGTKVYGDVDPTLTFAHAGLVNGDLATVFSGALGRAVGETVAGGPYAINQGTLSAGGNYAITYNGANFTITPASLTVTANAGTKVYGDVDPTLTFAHAGLVNGDLATVFSGALGRAVGETVAGGPYAINQGTLSAGGNYAITYNGANFTITPASLTVTANAGTKVYGDVDPTLTFAHAGLVNGDLATVFSGALGRAAGETVAGGPYAINQGTLSAGGNYAITYNGANFTITPKALVVGVAANSKVYDGTTAATGSVTSLVGVVGGDLVTANGSGTFTFADANAGVNKSVAVTGLTLSGADAGNYTLSSTGTSIASITPATLTVTANAGTKVYGAVDPGLTFGHAGFVGADTSALFTGGLARALGEAVAGGPYAINQGTLSAGGNYNIAYNGANFTITPASLTVTANAGTKVYGDVDPTLTFGQTGLVNGDTVAVFSGALARAAGEAVAGGPYAINQGTLTAGGNYNITFTGANFTITPKALTVAVTANNKVYDGTTAATGTIGGLVGIVGGDVVTANGSGSFAFADANVGNGKSVAVTGLALSGADAGNYTLSSTGASTANITPASLIVTANAGTKVYGAADPGLTFGHAGFVGADTLALFTGGLARAAGETVAGGPYAINQGTLSAGGNYNITFTGANFTITPKALTVSVAANNKVYDGTTAATGTIGGLVGIVGGDVVTANGSGSFTFADADAGVNKSVAVTGLALSGADAGNYTLSSTGASTANITPATLTVTANAGTKVYGAVDPSLTFGHAGFVGGDTSALFTGGLARAAGEAVAGGPYLINQGTLSAGGNYAITYNGANFTITPASLTVTANAGTKVYGAADPSLTFGHAGLVNGDLATVFSGALGRAAGETVAGGPYAINQGSLTAGGNYAITYNGANFTITPKALTVSVAANDKVYDGTTAATGTIGGLVGIVGGDVVTANGSGSFTFADANAGVNKSVSVTGLALSGADAGNYTLSSTGASTANITPATLTVTANAGTKVYGAVDPSLTFGHAGFVGADTSALFTGSLARAAGENVAAYLINQGTLSAGGNYNIAFTGANFTITPASLTVTANAGTKVYGDVDPTLTFGQTGLVNGDTVAVFSGALARAAGETVAGGPYAINQGTLSAGGNYAITYNGANFTITPKALTVAVTANNKVYDGTTAATGTIGGLVGIVGGDVVTANGSGSFTFADANAGVNKSVSVTGLALSGADAGNYTLSSTGASTADITQASLTVTANAGTKVYGAADPGLTFGHAGFVGLDTAALFTGSLARAVGETVAGGPYAINQGTLSAGGNYAITYNGANFTITPASLTVTADSLSKTEGDSVNLTGRYTVAGLQFADAVTGADVASIGAPVGAAVGPHATIVSNAVGTGLGNYTISFVNGTLTVNAQPVQPPVVQPPVNQTPDPSGFQITSVQPTTQQFGWRTEDTPVGTGEALGGFWSLPLLVQSQPQGGGNTALTTASSDATGSGGNDEEEEWEMLIGTPGRLGQRGSVGVIDVRPYPVSNISFTSAN